MKLEYDQKLVRDRRQLGRRQLRAETLQKQVNNAISSDADEVAFARITKLHALADQRARRLQEKREWEWTQHLNRLESRRKKLIEQRQQIRAYKHSRAYRLYGKIQILLPFEFLKVLEAQAPPEARAQNGNDQKQVA
jgi:hypothetical protein